MSAETGQLFWIQANPSVLDDMCLGVSANAQGHAAGGLLQKQTVMQHGDPRTEAGRLASCLKYVGVSLCGGVDQYAKELTFVQLDCGHYRGL